MCDIGIETRGPNGDKKLFKNLFASQKNWWISLRDRRGKIVRGPSAKTRHGTRGKKSSEVRWGKLSTYPL